MAKDKDKKDGGEEQGKSPGRAGPLVRIGMLALVVVVGAGGGYAVNRFLNAPNAATEQTPGETPEDDGPDSKEFVYIDFEPVTVTLNTPEKDRFIRGTMTLAVRKKHASDVTEMVEKKKPVLNDRLITYLSNLTLDDVGEAKNLNKIRREILEAFNHLLWPDDKPRIDHLLFKEFAVM